jgi:hypothetical protein
MSLTAQDTVIEVSNQLDRLHQETDAILQSRLDGLQADYVRDRSVKDEQIKTLAKAYARQASTTEDVIKSNKATVDMLRKELTEQKQSSNADKSALLEIKQEMEALRLSHSRSHEVNLANLASQRAEQDTTWSIIRKENKAVQDHTIHTIRDENDRYLEQNRLKVDSIKEKLDSIQGQAMANPIFIPIPQGGGNLPFAKAPNGPQQLAEAPCETMAELDFRPDSVRDAQIGMKFG